ncbi:TetR family transcriptional regulator [Variovorax sp. LjRoot175]|uniref:TetR family transcriptional regulator n=1 Tax=Variovorax sp. LjRoot175 TaxID=3342276 RepID=UPI003F5131A0
MRRVVAADKRVSIAAVAKEAGVSPALIHNKYPDIAEEIRKQSGKASRDQRDTKHRQLVEARDAIRDLRKQNDELLDENRKLASVNESLRRRLAEALAVANAKNVVPLKRPAR